MKLQNDCWKTKEKSQQRINVIPHFLEL